MPNTFAVWLQGQWHAHRPACWLVPFALLFRGAVGFRRMAYRKGWKRMERLPVPVIVVGNLTVGGAGKTPLTIWLAEFLAAKGYRPGVISRGYGGRKQIKPLAVYPDSDPGEAGDEPVLIARRTGCPVFVFHRRAEAGRALLGTHDCDVLLADDGLQHYALARDVEIVVIDGERRFGNGLCLPAGPLREPLTRMAEADLIVSRGHALEGEYPFSLSGAEAVNLANEALKRPLAQFVGVKPLFAVAGIGHPQRFFSELKAVGLMFEERAFPDHHRFIAGDLSFGPQAQVLMTEKDAVKCRGFACERHWYVPVRGQLPDEFGEKLLRLIEAKRDGQKAA